MASSASSSIETFEKFEAFASAWSEWAVDKINKKKQPVPFVASDDAIERKLALWYKRIRGQYARKSPNLTQERITEYENLPGWSWGKKRDDEFARKLREWQNIRERKGVELSHKSNNKNEQDLSKWARYMQILKMEGKIKSEYLEMFDQVPTWRWYDIKKTNYITFSDRIKEWNTFFTTHGHVPNEESGGDLYKWYSQMNEKKDTMNKDKVTRLNALQGWTWMPTDPEEQWMKKAKKWHSWVNLNEGHFPSMESSTNHVERHLGEFATQVKEELINGNLSDKFVSKLMNMYQWKKFLSE